MRKKKIYHINGYLFVPLDGEVLAASKNEAKEKWLKSFEHTELGYDYEPIIQDCSAGDESMVSEEELEKTESNVIYTNNKYVVS